MKIRSLIAFALTFTALALRAQGALVLQSDFGTRDGAVASMKGVALSVDPALRLVDLTHEIEPFNIWEAAYRLRQVTPFWARGTVFVSIIDPGVGTARKGIVARMKNGQLIVTPDNGTLTLLAGEVAEVREIDVARQRLPGSERSHTFHGRDVFAYLGARLASGKVAFDDVGPSQGTSIVKLPMVAAARAGSTVSGMVAMIDRPYGNLWTNITAAMADSAGFAVGDTLHVSIAHDGKEVYTADVPMASSFGYVGVGQPVLYLNSLLELAIAINQGSFAEHFRVQSGPSWRVKVAKRGAPKR
jgi:hypothetical protein